MTDDERQADREMLRAAMLRAAVGKDLALIREVLAWASAALVHAQPMRLGNMGEDADSVVRVWQCAGHDLAALTEISARHQDEAVRKYARECLHDILDEMHRALGRKAHR